ncbi:hypothetical protein [Pandoravirus japonicus]|uniref:Uncharacterized protein n=1 Tax=Pandoravirus japonicus TaxID=2823154 RepID=A0A811BMU1_9VIRU|nr:hypothetical protein [Pandoravirus japonicus]
MCFDMGVARLARHSRHRCPWPSPADTGTATIAAPFSDLPSLALEEVLWHHLVGEALAAAAIALADDENQDDDVTDVAVLRAWLASAYAPLYGMGEFWHAARRLVTAWPEIARSRLGLGDFAWRGVSPATHRAAGSITYVWARRRRGATTAAMRIGRVLARRVRHVMCVGERHWHVDPLFAALGIADGEVTYGNVTFHAAYDATGAAAWDIVRLFAEAHAREGALMIVDDGSGMHSVPPPLFDRAMHLGAHVVVTGQAAPTKAELDRLDRLAWVCSPDPYPKGLLQRDFATFAVTGVDAADLRALREKSVGDGTAYGTMVAQRRRDGAWDLQVMPYAPSSSSADAPSAEE